jgi:hypothetical protein
MFAYLGGTIALLYCLASLVFRWKVVVAKYGSLSLYWWVLAVTVGWSILGYSADLAIWSVQDAAWRALH